MNRIRFALLMALTCSLTINGFSQNLVPNNGFETYTALPSGYGQWYDAATWSNVNNYPAFAWPYASPDYLHMTGGGGADLPVCTFGTVTPYAGNAVMGFVTWLGTTPEFREYLSIHLSSPMVVGTPYTVAFWITNGSSGWYCGNSSNHLGVQFTMSPMTQLNHEPIGGSPQCEYAGEIWNTGWQYVSFTYTPDQAYNYITLGNFYNDASTLHTFRVAAASAGAYYFIDEVVVMPVAPLPITLTDFYAEQQESSTDLFWTTESEINSDHFTVQRSADGAGFNDLGTIAAAGNSTDHLTYAFTDDAPQTGMNYYRLAMVDRDGAEKYSDILPVYFENVVSSAITLYPNPVTDVVYFQCPNLSETAQLRIFDLSGQVIWQALANDAGSGIDVSQWAKGIYLVEVTDDTVHLTEKLVVH